MECMAALQARSPRRRGGSGKAAAARGFLFAGGGYDAGRVRGGGDMNENTTAVILAILIFILYLLPTLLAFARDIPRRKAVTLLNIILGWTLIGWIVAFLWATLEATTPEEV